MDWDRAMDRDYLPGGDGLAALAQQSFGRMDAADHQAAHELRLLAVQARIAAETQGREAVTKSTRGTPQRVVCLTMLGRDGKPREFASVTEAAAAVKARRVHHVRNAILRNGKCMGHKFAYLKAA